MSGAPAELVAAFWKLAAERVAESTDHWLAFEDGDRQRLQPLRRLMHTVKGEAHMLGLGTCALQASACARPVVLTRTRGLWDPDGLRDGENVLLVPPADPAALATTVGRILSEEGLGEALGAAARESVTAAASVERYAERLLAICGEALARP